MSRGEVSSIFWLRIIRHKSRSFFFFFLWKSVRIKYFIGQQKPQENTDAGFMWERKGDLLWSVYLIYDWMYTSTKGAGVGGGTRGKWVNGFNLCLHSFIQETVVYFIEFQGGESNQLSYCCHLCRCFLIW